MDEDKQTPSEEDITTMLEAERTIANRFPRILEINGRRYKVRQISKAIRRRIHDLELEAYQLSGRQKDPMSLREARKISRKLDRLHAKTAAYYLLGNKALWKPFAFALTWRRLMRQPEEVCAQINAAAINQSEINFSLANWQNTEQQLVLSMRPIGESVKQMLKRMESASQQVDEDATKKKEADSKSGASPRKRPKMNG